MTLPFTGIQDFFRWLLALIIMIPVTIYVLFVGILFYLTVKMPDENGGASGEYCDHFDTK